MGCASNFFNQGKDAEYRFQKFFTAFFRISNRLHPFIHLYCFLKVLVFLLFSSQIILYAESFSTVMFMEIGNIEVCQSVKYFHFPIRRIFISVKFSLNHKSDHHYHSLMYKKAQSDQRCVLQIHSGLYISN